MKKKYVRLNAHSWYTFKCSQSPCELSSSSHCFRDIMMGMYIFVFNCTHKQFINTIAYVYVTSCIRGIPLPPP